MDEDEVKYDNRSPEMITLHPHLEHAGPDEHLMWVRKSKERVKVPVIASLNAVNRDIFIEYAKLLEQTGVDGLELNLYSSPGNFDKSALSIEEDQIPLLKAVHATVKVPFSVKLSFSYTNPLHFILRLDKEGIPGFVLFNRFFQPEIDIVKEKHLFPLNLSSPVDNRLPLRFTGLLSGNIRGDICCSTGIFEATDVIKMILAGAACVQMVSGLYKNQITCIGRILKDMEEWMCSKNYETLDNFKGMMNAKNCSDPWAYTRLEYAHLLLNPDEIINNFPALG